MGDRTGIGLVEDAILATMAERGAIRLSPFMKSARIIRAVAERHGVHHDYAYPAIAALSSRELVPVPLIERHGDLGAPGRPAAPCLFTEVRLTRAGELAVDSERGDGPKLPFGLINGDMYAGGTSPAFDPSRALDALTLAIEHPDVDEAELTATVGPPVAPNHATAETDLAALHAGQRTRTHILTLVDVGCSGPESSAGSAHLRAPLGTLIRRAVDPDPAAQLDAIAQLRAAISADRG
jgi:hypothetical protein